ncbi:MAG: putative negative regulator of RcsB-dependent stress response [Methylophilaceae bacterium]|jgi:predicted negative regulator of RcsB-dependent stress response
MALDLDDQEQLDEFKAWWDQYGKLTVNLVLLALITYASWQGYQYFQHKKAVEASEVYQTLGLLDPSESDTIKDAANKLMTDYVATPYAGRAAVLQARSEFLAGETDESKAKLEWAIANAQETSVKAIASLQLARILLDNKDYAGAEKILSADVDPGYDGLKNDLQGDILLAQGKVDEAKKLYASALNNLEPDGRLYLFTKQKLESLGS